MIRILRIVALLFCIGNAKGEDWYASWDKAGKTWYEKWNNTISNAPSLPEHQQIEVLGHALAIKRGNERLSEQQRSIYERAQSALLAIPGHATYYRDRIIEERAKYEEVRKLGNPTDMADQRSKWSEAAFGFTVMANLPSVETVGVLGEFLYDERGKMTLPENASYEEKVQQIYSWPNCNNALSGLHALRIVSKPYKPLGSDYMLEEMESGLKAWRDWYEQIKAGNRTFRFEGDPTEYDLNGPAPKEKLARIEREQKRDAERVSGGKKGVIALADGPASDPVGKSSAFIGIFIALALCALAAWTYLRGKLTA